ncbi:MAG TPA: GNAT family N-acetyltransferase [Ktedonobacterales bacterium]|jgi:ribosomal protein S18 acetylase RimI-like enzyme|nr:GNAT family N-acetyltransferase [Ktedonobacterales bacterium]
MADTAIEIQRLDAAPATELVPQLVTLLQDAVADGASLGFWNPLSDALAQAYWRDVIAEVAQGRRRLLVALRDGALLGSAQLDLPTKQNARRRAEVQKLIVYRSARRQGIGQALMRAIERVAADEGRTLLILDTAGSAAERLYRALGYQQVGVIPRYTIEADGAELATTVFYKSLDTSLDTSLDASSR